MRTRIIAGFTAAAVVLSATPAFAQENEGDTTPAKNFSELANDTILSQATKDGLAAIQKVANDANTKAGLVNPTAEGYNKGLNQPAEGLFGAIATGSSESLIEQAKGAEGATAEEKAAAETKAQGSTDSLFALAKPGLENDVKNGYAPGYTANALMYTGIAAVVLAIVAAIAQATGLLSGLGI